MVAGPIGTSWKPGSWKDTAWKAGSWKSGRELVYPFGGGRDAVSELSLLVAGVSHRIEPETLYASFPANGRGTLTCRIVSEDGSYVPLLDQDVYLFAGALILFGGVVMQAKTEGVDNEGFAPITSTIDVASFAAYTDRRWVNSPVAPGTLKSQLAFLVTNYLSAYGVTLDPTQVDGPTMEAFAYPWVLMTDVLNNLSERSGGYLWEISVTKQLRMYAPGTNAAPFNIIDGDGNAIGHPYDIVVDGGSRLNSERPYANYVSVLAGPAEALLLAIAYNSAEITAHTLWEMAVSAPTVTTQAAADELAAALLAQHLPTPKQVAYSTYKLGLKPGQTQTITVADRHIDNTFLISEVQLGTDGDLLVWSVQAVEGTIYQGNWRDGYGAFQSGLPSVGGSPGVVSSPGSVGAVYFLGGGATEAVMSPTPTDWVATSALEIILDTVTRGSTAGTVVVRLRADAGSVTVRLRNISDGITVGTSIAVTSTTFQNVSFAVSLTPGTKTYRLEGLGSLPGVEISAIGYFQ